VQVGAADPHMGADARVNFSGTLRFTQIYIRHNGKWLQCRAIHTPNPKQQGWCLLFGLLLFHAR
jgi:hypothetical protein